MHAMLTQVLTAVARTATASVAMTAAAGDLMHFESPHIHPLALTPDGSRLLAVNTPDARLEVFDVLPNAPYLRYAGSITVGVEPVSVRARSATEAWVVNHVSDTVSIVDLAGMRVAATLETGDEPCDVVFAGSPQRAFVSVSGLDRIEMFDPLLPLAAPQVIPLVGDMPRALATDGVRVYAAFFGAGNETTVLSESVVGSALSPYPGAPNPPPNDGFLFSPACDPTIPPPAPASLVVRKDASGAWRDVNGFDWSSAVDWDTHGHDLAILEPDGRSGALRTRYARGLMGAPLGMTNMSASPDVWNFPPLPPGGPEDNWGQNRDLMKRGHATGFPQHLGTEDFAMFISQGPIVDRSDEQLCSADGAVLRVRQALLRAVREFQAGQVPTLADSPQLDYRSIRSVGGVIPAGSDWRALCEAA